jgi:hypothetical protein
LSIKRGKMPLTWYVLGSLAIWMLTAIGMHLELESFKFGNLYQIHQINNLAFNLKYLQP